jgi:hypothetical protein
MHIALDTVIVCTLNPCARMPVACIVENYAVCKLCRASHIHVYQGRLVRVFFYDDALTYQGCNATTGWPHRTMTCSSLCAVAMSRALDDDVFWMMLCFC